MKPIRYTMLMLQKMLRYQYQGQLKDAVKYQTKLLWTLTDVQEFKSRGEERCETNKA